MHSKRESSGTDQGELEVVGSLKASEGSRSDQERGVKSGDEKEKKFDHFEAAKGDEGDGDDEDYANKEDGDKESDYDIPDWASEDRFPASKSEVTNSYCSMRYIYERRGVCANLK